MAYQDPLQAPSAAVAGLGLLALRARWDRRALLIVLRDDPGRAEIRRDPWVSAELRRLRTCEHAAARAYRDASQRLEHVRRRHGVPSVVTYALMPRAAQALVRRRLRPQARPQLTPVGRAPGARASARRTRRGSRRPRSPGRQAEDSDPPHAGVAADLWLSRQLGLPRQRVRDTIGRLVADAIAADPRLTCSRCQRLLEPDEFRRRPSGSRESWCGTCKAASARRYRAAARTEVVA